MESNTEGFSEAFQSLKRDLNPAVVRKVFRAGILLGLTLVAVFVALDLVHPYTDYLWYVHDVRLPRVFELSYTVKGLLFTPAFFLSWIWLQLNLRKALQLTLVFVSAPSTQAQKVLTGAIGYLQLKGASIIRIVSPMIALLMASEFSGEYNTYLMASHAHPFGRTDPFFGLDLGFFVFSLPWYQAIASFLFTVLCLTCVLTVGVYAGLQGLASLAKVELSRPAVRLHIHVLIGLATIAFACHLFLVTYDAGLMTNAQFTGAGFADALAVEVERWLAVGLALVGIATGINGRVGRAYAVPRNGVIGFVVAYLIGVALVPSAVDRFYVRSNQLAKQAPFAKRAIEMTRFAYGLDQIQVNEQNPTDQPTAAEVKKSKVTLDNMRLWDPTVLRDCLEAVQGIRPYYRFFDVDVDRYPIKGRQSMVMLAPREMDLDGLLPNAQNWTSERLLYTHGYGVVVSEVDATTTEGEPVLLDQDVPQRSDPQLSVTEPRIYYGNAHDESGSPVDQYALVNTKQAEFDYPTSDSDVSTRWSGDRGILLGSLVNRLAFSIVLGDINILVSSSMDTNARLLMHRNVIDRARRMYPFLSFDPDPYVVLIGGRVEWILDGYTTTNRIPYSAVSERGPNTLNYIRNSVKVVIDAYTGVGNAYSMDDSEPILSAWREIYPGLVKPQREVPSEIAAHFRYPEELLKLQSAALCSYHVQNPAVFLGNGDSWSISAQRGLHGDLEPIEPFYVEMQLPDRSHPEFVQILPFSPNGRPTMTGWLAAHCDPGEYGHLTLYLLNQSNPIPGPEQIEGAFSTAPEIANINKQFQNQNSSIVVGNLLVIPLGNSFMYAESLFLRSSTQGLQSAPRLTKVILAVKGKTPVVKDTYAEALAALFSESGVQEKEPASSSGVAPTADSLSSARRVLQKLDQADAALRAGDFARYGQLQNEARTQLRNLLGSAAGQSK